MKKILMLALALMLTTPAYSNIQVASQRGYISNVAISATAMTSAGGPYYTDPIKVENYDGYIAFLVVLASGGSPSISLTVQASMDGTNFYDTYDADGDALWSVSGITSSRHIHGKLPLSKYVRVKITAAADSTVSLTTVFRSLQ